MGKGFEGRENRKPNFSNKSLRGGKGGRDRRGGRGIGAKGKSKTVIEPHQRFPGIFISTTPKESLLITKNYAVGQTVYGEKHIQVEDTTNKNEDGTPLKIEYRVWNAFRSKLGAAIINGIRKIYMEPGSKVLYLGAASGTTISHVSDIVGDTGVVYG